MNFLINGRKINQGKHLLIRHTLGISKKSGEGDVGCTEKKLVINMWLSRAEKSQTVITIASEPHQRVWDFCFSLLDLSELKQALKSFLGILPLNPCFFFHHLVPHICPSIWHVIALKTTEHCFGTRDTLKKMICLSISLECFLLLCHFHMNLNKQNSWPHWLSTYRWQFSTSTGNHFYVN